MTKAEFTSQFDRLCKGLDYQATVEQAEAIYRRIGHVAVSVWAESVTTVLCDGRRGYLPKLEHLLDVIEREAEAQRKAAVTRDQFQAKKTYALLKREIDPEQPDDMPRPGTPLFACIRACAERQWLQGKLALKHPRTLLDGRDPHQAARKRIEELSKDIEQWSAGLDDPDAEQLVLKYERQEVS